MHCFHVVCLVGASLCLLERPTGGRLVNELLFLASPWASASPPSPSYVALALSKGMEKELPFNKLKRENTRQNR